MRILTVCLGNICRSPTAEVVLRDLAAREGLALEVDSCGTGNWHVGNPPYGPMIEAASARGYDLRPLRARQLSQADYNEFDLILAMDRENLADLKARAPDRFRARLRLFLTAPETDVPDPYFTRDFDEALEMIEEGATRLVRDLSGRAKV